MAENCSWLILKIYSAKEIGFLISILSAVSCLFLSVLVKGIWCDWLHGFVADSVWKIVLKSSIFVSDHLQHFSCVYQQYSLQWRHMDAMTSQITSNSAVRSTVCSGLHQRKYQSPASLDHLERNTPVTGGFPSQRASNTEIVFMPDVITDIQWNLSITTT